MVFSGLDFPTGNESAREFMAVVGQKLDDVYREGLVQRTQESSCHGGRRVLLDRGECPECSPVDVFKLIGSTSCIGCP